MSERPYAPLSAATWIDGCLDDATDARILPSADVDRAAGPPAAQLCAPRPLLRAVQGERPGDRRWLQLTIDISRLCPPVEMTYSVGAVIVSPDGRELSRGYSRETDRHVHAEEAALAKLGDTTGDLAGATMYTSLEPCSVRRSRIRTCTELILNAGIRRVVLAMREPLVFVDCEGVEVLDAAGVQVVEFEDMADQVFRINAGVMRTLK